MSLTRSPSTVTSGTATVTVSWVLWGQTRYASYEDGAGVTDWSVSGGDSGSGSTSGWNEPAMGTWVIASGSQAVSTSYSSAVTFTLNGQFRSGAAYPGVTPKVTVSTVIPKRPYAVPAAPSAVSATRESDTAVSLVWTRNATSTAPYTSQTIWQRTWTGGTLGAWVSIANPSGTATSYMRTGLSANHVYMFQIRANNTSGSSGFDPFTNVYMTPGAPTGVKSSVSAAGTTIRTTWTNTAYTGTSTLPTFRVQRSVNGGAYATVATGILQSTPSWTDPNPGVGTNRYRVAASVGSLVSTYTVGNTVTTVVAPLAPNLLAPNGTAWPVESEPVTLTWAHRDNGDGADQSHFTVRVSGDGGGTWSTVANNVASTVSQWVMPAGTLTNGTTWLWQVATQGSTLAGFGPYSTSATIVGSARPVLTLDPNNPAPTTQVLPVAPVWVYAQDQGSPQAMWEATLWDAAGTGLLQQVQDDGPGDRAVFTFPFVDGDTYVVRVRAKSGAGVWSGWVEASTLIDLPPPAKSYVEAVFNPCTGSMNLHLTADLPGVGEASVDTVVVERRIEGGEWVVIAAGIEVPADVTDLLPLTHGVNEYRVTSVSVAPSYLVNDTVTADGTDGEPGSDYWTFLAYGDDFGTVLRFRGNPQPAATSGRVRAAQHFLGRAKPVLLAGVNTDHSVSTSGELRYDTSCPVFDPNDCVRDAAPWDWTTAGLTAEVVCYRDYTGRRVFGMLSGVDVKDGPPGTASVSFTVTETEFGEAWDVSPVP